MLSYKCRYFFADNSLHYVLAFCYFILISLSSQRHDHGCLFEMTSSIDHRHTTDSGVYYVTLSH